MGGTLTIRVDAGDNVAIAAGEGGLAAGTDLGDGLRTAEAVPPGHKVALSGIPRGAAVLRYGVPIGFAREDLKAGSWVHEGLVDLPPSPDLASLDCASAGASAPLPPLAGRTFLGYPNPDGSAGTKNLLGIVPSVQCVSGVVARALARIEAELLPRYPGVDGALSLDHAYGCGVAIDAPDADIPIRTIANLARHPNFGGRALAVGLGCEKLPPERLLPEGGLVLRLQDLNGFSAQVAAIMKAAELILEGLSRRRREARPLSDLVVGLQCGGSDAFSGVTANPVLGWAADLLVRSGATVLFSEVTEARDAVQFLLPRCADAGVAGDLLREMAWYDAYLERGGVDRAANTTPGNKAGGLANIAEKALGSIVKSGSSPIVQVLRPGERPTKRGLVFAATPASDFVCGTEQLASGMHLQVFSTGRGTPYGLALAPVVKVSSNSRLAASWPDLIDLDAGVVASGRATIADTGTRLFETILAVAGGTELCRADRLGLRNSLAVFNPAPIT